MKTLGRIETVSFPEFNISNIAAKIDTGAFTGALHCTKIHKVEEGTRTILKFSPFDYPDTEIEVTDFVIKYVRSSNGGSQSRFLLIQPSLFRGKLTQSY